MDRKIYLLKSATKHMLTVGWHIEEMKKLKYILFLIVSFGFSEYQQSDLYPRFEYDEVKVFVIDKVDVLMPKIDLIANDGQINSTSKGLKLTNSQIKDLISIINDTLSYGQVHSYSYAPSIGFIFYKDKKIIDWIELGFVTNTMTSKYDIKAQYKYYSYFMGDSTVIYDLIGLSNIGRQKFRQLLNDIKIIDPKGDQTRWDSINVDYNELMKRY